MNKTISLIKPDAIKNGHEEAILHDIEKAGFTIKNLKRMVLDEALAKQFYQEHAEKGFFQALLDYMTSGEIIAIELESGNAVSKFRDLIGTTDPLTAPEGSLRYKYGVSRDFNAVHGSESDESAERESILLFG